MIVTANRPDTWSEAPTSGHRPAAATRPPRRPRAAHASPTGCLSVDDGELDLDPAVRCAAIEAA